MDGERAEKLNRRWDNPETSTSSPTPMAGGITGRGVVTREWPPGSGAAVDSGPLLDTEGDTPRPLYCWCFIFFFFCPVSPVGQIYPRTRKQWNMGNVVSWNTEAGRDWWERDIKEANNQVSRNSLAFCHRSGTEANTAVPWVCKMPVQILILPLWRVSREQSCCILNNTSCTSLLPRWERYKHKMGH